MSCVHHRDAMPTSAEPCRPCLCVRSVRPLPSQALACRAVRHGVPPRFGASSAVQPAVLPHAARGGPLPVTRSPFWVQGDLPAAARTRLLLALPGGGAGLPVATHTRMRIGSVVGTIFVIAR